MNRPVTAVCSFIYQLNLCHTVLDLICTERLRAPDNIPGLSGDFFAFGDRILRRMN